MGKWIGDFGNWLMTHLVALGFLAFAVVGIVFYEPIFDAKQPPKGPPPEQATVAEARVPTPPKPARPVAPEKQGSQFRPLLPEEIVAATQEPKPAAPPAPAAASKPKPAPPAKHRLRPLSEQPSGEGAAQGESDNPWPGLPPLLVKARQAFIAGRLAEAESFYLEHLHQHPKDADAFGELGNLYYAMGRPQDALDAYYQAGIRLRRMPGRAESLKLVISLLKKAGDPRAEVLEAPRRTAN